MSEISHNCSCDSCKISNFKGSRFKCSLCPNFNLCSECFNHDRIGTNQLTHRLNHPMICIEDPACSFSDIPDINKLDLKGLRKIFLSSVHDVNCSGCSKQKIKGLFFKCKKCENINVCLECYSSGNHPSHPLYAIGNYLLFEIFVFVNL